jgi:membrane-associated protease RseP (regulator of RpoE activity)
VKIVGMTPLEEVDPGDEERAFYRQPWRERLVVLAAGSVIHLLIAFVVIFGIVASYGDPIRSRPVPVVDSTAKCVVTNPARDACSSTDPRAPAYGVLRSGDRIVRADGRPVGTYAELRALLQRNAGHVVTLDLVRHGRVLTVRLTPVAVTIGGKPVGKVGFYPTFVPDHVSVAGAVPRTFTTFGTLFTSTISALGQLPHEVSVIVHGQPRSNGAASVVGIARASGQLAQTRASVGARVANFLFIVAQVNFFVGIFNLLPLLPLDGGHMAIVGFEVARRRLYRAFRRPDPGRVDLMKIMPVTYAVVALFIGLSLLLLYADIVNPIRLQ